MAGRIYIGFPTKDDANSNVFADDLGFAGGLGTVIPCWFKTGLGYIEPVTGKNLTCKLRTSPYAPKHAYIEILNFEELPAETNVKLVLGKIMNPSSKKYDVNFLLKINRMDASTREEFGLY